MRINVTADQPARAKAAALAIPIFENGEAWSGTAKIDRALGGLIRGMRRIGEFKGRDQETYVFPVGSKVGAKRVILVGLGRREDFSVASLAKFAGFAVRHSDRRGFASVALALPDQVEYDLTQAGELAAEGAIMATFDPAPYQSEPETKHNAVKALTLLASQREHVAALKRGVGRGIVLGEAANVARDMVNRPANEMTPTHLAQAALALGKKSGLKVTVLDSEDMRRLGMGAFLSVSAGSDQPPKMIAIEYRGDKDSKTTLGLVGKGITFDTGGISLKPALDMHEMKGDMAGGATVIGVLSAIGELKPKVNVIGVVCASENMPSGKATRPGDVVRAMNGKSIEITNTDAEGRLVLADGLCWARKLGATHVIDIATLTGAAVIALGHTTTGVMTNDRELVDLFHQASHDYGERYWELPLFPEYRELLKSQIADMKNSGGRAAGTIYGAMFLKEFVDDAPWIHFDIAGTSWAERDGGHIVKGPTAVALRPLVRLAELVQGRRLHRKADEAAHRRLSDGTTAR